MKEVIRSTIEQTQYFNHFLAIVVAMVFSAIRAAAKKRAKKMIKTFLIAFPVAWVAGEIAWPYFPENRGIVFAICAGAALLSEDIVEGIIESGDSVQEKIKLIIEAFFNVSIPKWLRKDK